VIDDFVGLNDLTLD